MKNNIEWWGNNYFKINDLGHVEVCPDPDVPKACVDLAQLVKEREKQGQRLPALFCFPQLLVHRVRSINQAFVKAREDFSYKGQYFLVYPVKVNQHRRVLDAITQSGEKVGLEAGSKAELLAVLAHAGRTGTVVVCNGYKDEEFISLALMGQKLGHKIFIVIEKLSELDIVLKEAQRLNVKPLLGVRARLASQGSGKWQSSGGDKSKFGLSSTQILELVKTLKEHNLLESLELIHFHLGSQMSNIRDIVRGVRESAAFFVQLSKLDCKLKYFDVGGGLGVDYEGTRSQTDCSVNYGLKEYANNIVFTIAQACREHNLEEPVIITESGRALTAYHTVLVTNVIGVEQIEVTDLSSIPENSPSEIESMFKTYLEAKAGLAKRSVREWLHDGQMDLSDVQQGFSRGLFTLEQRALAEKLYLGICKEVQDHLDLNNRLHRTLYDDLAERMADKLYLNFSLFQSLPDAWGIGQIFPISPLENLNQEATRRAILFDVTCDSDGAIKQYVEGEDVKTTLALPSYNVDDPPLIGFFMAGAYQEILGNNHNLFGDTEAYDVYVFEDKVQVKLSDEGDTAADMLHYVNLDAGALLKLFTSQVHDSTLDEREARLLVDSFREALYGYTYLE